MNTPLTCHRPILSVRVGTVRLYCDVFRHCRRAKCEAKRPLLRLSCALSEAQLSCAVSWRCTTHQAAAGVRRLGQIWVRVPGPRPRRSGGVGQGAGGQVHGLRGGHRCSPRPDLRLALAGIRVLRNAAVTTHHDQAACGLLQGCVGRQQPHQQLAHFIILALAAGIAHRAGEQAKHQEQPTP